MQDNLGNERNEESVSREKNDVGLKVFGLVCIAVLLVAITALLTFSLTVNHFLTPSENGGKLYKTVDVVKEYLNAYAYFEVDEQKRIEAAVKGYVSASDDKYSEFYNSEEFKALNEDNEGRFVGIGVTITESEIIYLDESLTLIEIVNVYENSPALEAGLRDGDLIYSVYTPDGEIFADDVGMDVASSKIKGEEGTEVSISVLRPMGDSYEKIDFTLERRKVEIKSVAWAVSDIEPTVGVVSVKQFDLNTPVLLSAAFDSFREQNIKKVVIDMRDNGGGDLNSVIACANYFLNAGDIIISAEDKAGDRVEYNAGKRSYVNSSYSSCEVKEEDVGKYRDFKIAVLVNGNTASAAELLTAVFRDYDLAPIVGVKTFGKGTMQTIFSLKRHGIDGGIKFTTDVYFPPCGENYDGEGITPDIIVTLDESGKDTQMLAAVAELTK